MPVGFVQDVTTILGGDDNSIGGYSPYNHGRVAT